MQRPSSEVLSTNERWLAMRILAGVSDKQLEVLLADTTRVRRAFAMCMEHLSFRDRQLLELRFGFGRMRCHTQAEVGKVLKYSQSHISNLESAAIYKLTREPLAKLFRDTLDRAHLITKPTEDLDTYAAVYERDIDVLLVQGIQSCRAMQTWLLENAGLPAKELLRVRHSLPTTDGRECDIEVRFGTPEAAYVLQIENKLDAGFQPDQQESYRARTESLAESSDVVAARCILICPMRYAQSADGGAFDAILTYETARELLLAEGAWGRSAALVIQHAIDKHRRGGTDSPIDESRTEFFRSFSELAHQHGLPLIPHRPRKRNAGFLWWPRAGTLRQPRGWNPRGSHGASLSAKLIHGFADIELTGVGSVCDILKLAQEFDEHGITHERNEDHLRIRRDAPQLDPSSEFESQREEANTFVRALTEQHQWWHNVGCDLVVKLINMQGS